MSPVHIRTREIFSQNTADLGYNRSLPASLYQKARRLGIFVLSIDALVDSAVNEYLAIDSGGNASDMVIALNCCMAIMLPGEAELVSE